MQIVERDALVLDVDLEALFMPTRDIDPITDLALERDIGDKSLHRLRVDPRQVPCVGVPIRIAVGDVEEQDEIVATGRVQVGCGGRSSHLVLLPFILRR